MIDFDVLLNPSAPGYLRELRRWWEENVAIIRAEIWRACRKLGEADVEDILQETFLRVFRKIGDFRNEPKDGSAVLAVEVVFLSWVKTIARRLAYTECRAKDRIVLPDDETSEPEWPQDDEETVIDRIDRERERGRADQRLSVHLGKLREWESQLITYVKPDPERKTTMMARDPESVPAIYEALRAHVRAIHGDLPIKTGAEEKGRESVENTRRARLAKQLSRAKAKLVTLEHRWAGQEVIP